LQHEFGKTWKLARREDIACTKFAFASCGGWGPRKDIITPLLLFGSSPLLLFGSSFEWQRGLVEMR
jgi:hypothetical protein